MAVTPADIVNEAIQLIGDNQATVTGSPPSFDGSTAGKAAGFLYTPTVQAVARSFGWDFAKSVVTLAFSGNTAPFPWVYEFSYPLSAVEVLQLLPTSGELPDPNDPYPIDWIVGNAVVTSVQQRVIWSKMLWTSALINNAPAETAWDATFREAVVRLLASGLAMAIAGKPDVAAAMIEQYTGFSGIGKERQY